MRPFVNSARSCGAAGPILIPAGGFIVADQVCFPQFAYVTDAVAVAKGAIFAGGAVSETNTASGAFIAQE